MKRILTSLVALAILCNLSAQRTYVPTAEDLKIFNASTTYVVLVDNPLSDYNMQIRDAIEKHWKITPYAYIQMKDFEDKSRDTTASFLYVSTLAYERDKTATRYVYLCLSLGGDHFTLGEIRDVANVPLGYYGVEEDEYSYKLSTLVRFMQNHVEGMNDKKVPLIASLYSQYNRNMPELKNKTLYLIREELASDIDTEKEIAAIYQGKFRIVDQQEAREIIISEDEDAVVLHKVGPKGDRKGARVYKILFGVGDAMIYSYDSHKINSKNPNAFLAKDLKKLARSIQ